MTADDATINAVAAAIAAAQNVPFPGPRQRKIAERLAEAGWLKDPADRVLTPTDLAVLDAADVLAAAEEELVRERSSVAQRRYDGAKAVLVREAEKRGDAVRARRAAVGVSAPADPKEQP